MLLDWNIHRNHGADYREGGEEAERQEEDEFSGCGGDGVVLLPWIIIEALKHQYDIICINISKS